MTAHAHNFPACDACRVAARRQNSGRRGLAHHTLPVAPQAGMPAAHAAGGAFPATGLRPEQFAPGEPIADLAAWLAFEDALYVGGEWRPCAGTTAADCQGREVRQALWRVRA